jgi:ArsR family transcriptional regulator
LYALAEEPCNVTQLAERLNVPQPTISRHLATLRQSGVVATRREGAGVIYSISETRIIEVLDLMRSMLKDMLERQSNLLDGMEA